MELEEGALVDEIQKKEKDETIIVLSDRVAGRDYLITQMQQLLEENSIPLPDALQAYRTQLGEEKEQDRGRLQRVSKGPADFPSLATNPDETPSSLQSDKSSNSIPKVYSEKSMSNTRRNSHTQGSNTKSDLSAARTTHDQSLSRVTTADDKYGNSAGKDRRGSSSTSSIVSYLRRKFEKASQSPPTTNEAGAKNTRLSIRALKAGVPRVPTTGSYANGCQGSEAPLKQKRANILAVLNRGRKASLSSLSNSQGAQQMPSSQEKRPSGSLETNNRSEGPSTQTKVCLNMCFAPMYLYATGRTFIEGIEIM